MSRTALSFLPTLALSQLASRVLLMLAALVVIAGCGTKAPEYDPTANWNAERLFQDGKTEMNAANWRVAKERFAAVEARFPFGVYAQQAQINLAYCQWKDKEPELALGTLNRFQQQSLDGLRAVPQGTHQLHAAQRRIFGSDASKSRRA